MFLYTTDRTYLPLACMSMASLAQHYRGPRPLSFALLLFGIDKEDTSRATDFIADLGAEFTVRHVNPERFRTVSPNSEQPPAMFGPLQFDTLLGDVPDRIVKLDCDTLILGDVSPLLDLPLDGYAVGAVDDLAILANGRVDTFNARLQMPQGSGYFNAGVQVIDTKRWIENAVGARAIEMIQTTPDILKWQDQCALNAVLAGRWKRLPYRWNALNGACPRDWPATVCHFAGWYKPWALGAWSSLPLMDELVGRHNMERYDRLVAGSPWKEDFGRADWLSKTALIAYRLAYHAVTGRLRQVRARRSSPLLLDHAARHPDLML